MPGLEAGVSLWVSENPQEIRQGLVEVWAQQYPVPEKLPKKIHVSGEVAPSGRPMVRHSVYSGEAEYCAGMRGGKYLTYNSFWNIPTVVKLFIEVSLLKILPCNYMTSPSHCQYYST